MVSRLIRSRQADQRSSVPGRVMVPALPPDQHVDDSMGQIYEHEGRSHIINYILPVMLYLFLTEGYSIVDTQH